MATEGTEGQSPLVFLLFLCLDMHFFWIQTLYLFAVVVVFHNVVVVCSAVFFTITLFYLFIFISFFFLFVVVFVYLFFHFFSFSSLPPPTPEPVVESAFEGLCLHSVLSETVSDVCKTRTM